MAVTKIHPIKSTLKKALDYIENPDKTEDKMLVSSFGCSYETADIEFEMLLAQAIQKGNNLAHHLIQSFAPGEATPEQAHEIGKLLADEVLQGKYSKYSYVLTTHIDKGHVHNYLIFCAVELLANKTLELIDILFSVLPFCQSEFLKYVLEFALSANPTISSSAKLLYHHLKNAFLLFWQVLPRQSYRAEHPL